MSLMMLARDHICEVALATFNGHFERPTLRPRLCPGYLTSRCGQRTFCALIVVAGRDERVNEGPGILANV
jgi:hypothetical protein